MHYYKAGQVYERGFIKTLAKAKAVFGPLEAINFGIIQLDTTVGN